MSVKTRKRIQAELIKKAYFRYWRLQNDPEYISFYAKERELKGKTNTDEMRKFGLGSFLVDPSKKIDWSNFNDEEILQTAPTAFDIPLKHTIRQEILNNIQARLEAIPSIRTVIYGDKSPFLQFRVDLRFNKKEILESLSSQIDRMRKVKRIKPFTREFINKIPLYAQIWDLRKGLPKKSFKEIGRELRQPFSTVVSRFKKAFELLYGKPYESVEYKKKILAIIKKKTCKDCPEYSPDCPGCPELMFELEMIEGGQPHKIIFDRKEQKESTIQLISDHKQFQEWQRQEYE